MLRPPPDLPVFIVKLTLSAGGFIERPVLFLSELQTAENL